MIRHLLRPRMIAALVVALALGMMTGAAPLAASPSTQWQYFWGPDGTFLASFDIESISCPTATFCVASGQYNDEGLILTWDGQHWTTAWRTTDQNIGSLSVSCASAALCMTGGGADLLWNGATWTEVTPSVDGVQPFEPPFFTVGCSGTSCIAIGSHNVNCGGGPFGVQAPPCTIYADEWSNGHWRGAADLTSADAFQTSQGVGLHLTKTACTSASWCMVMGYEQGTSGPTGQPVSMTWTPGTSFGPVSVLPYTDRTSTTGDVVEDVSCATPDSCTAVGAFNPIIGGFDQPLAYVWNGTGWSIAPTPPVPPTPDTWLNAVSCSSGGSCVVLGLTGHRMMDQGTPIAYRLHGATWSPVTVPAPMATTYRFDSVTCVGDTCMVAAVAGTTGAVLQLTGSAWAVVPTAYSVPGSGHSFTGISCVSANFCAAVGPATDPDGATHANLSIYRGPNRGQPDQYSENWTTGWGAGYGPTPKVTPLAVSCASETMCMAAGNGLSGNQTWPLAETLSTTGTGTGAQISWRDASPPRPNVGEDAGFTALSCPSATTCVAAGWQTTGGLGRVPLLDEWTSGVWTPMATAPQPTPGAQGTGGGVTGVSCTSPSFCLAVGPFPGSEALTTGGVSAPLALAWNGARWTAVPVTATASITDQQVTSVSCVTPTFCEVAGTATVTGHSSALVGTWNGSALVLAVPAISVSGDIRAVTGISCDSLGTCFAVGSTMAGDGIAHTLVLADHDRRWTEEPSGNQGSSTPTQLSAVSCAGTFCVAAGEYSKDTVTYNFLLTNVSTASSTPGAASLSSSWQPSPSLLAGVAAGVVMVGVGVGVGTYRRRRRKPTG